ncbi:hypothetical protein GCM10020370_02940 [Paenibacillus hodogayensis]
MDSIITQMPVRLKTVRGKAPGPAPPSEPTNKRFHAFMEPVSRFYAAICRQRRSGLLFPITKLYLCGKHERIYNGNM